MSVSTLGVPEMLAPTHLICPACFSRFAPDELPALHHGWCALEALEIRVKCRIVGTECL